MFGQTKSPPQYFVGQFIAEDGLLVYRRHGTGPAYRITEQQRLDWITGFNRQNRMLQAWLVAAMLIFFGGLLFVLDGSDRQPSNGTLAATGIIASVIFIASFTWLSMRNAVRPARDLAGRAPLAPELDKREWSRSKLRETRWGNFAVAPLAAIFIIWRLSEEFDIWRGWGLFAWLAPIGLVGFAGLQALRKLRADRGS